MLQNQQKTLVLVLGGPGSGKDSFIAPLLNEARLGEHAVHLGPHLPKVHALEGLHALHQQKVTHPEKLPAYQHDYDTIIRQEVDNAVKAGISVIVNGHGDDIERMVSIMDTAGAKGYDIITVAITMSPEDAFKQHQHRCIKGKATSADLPRVLEMHQSSRSNLNEMIMRSDTMLIFSRKIGNAPTLSIHYTLEDGDIQRTVYNREGHHNFRKWDGVDIHAKTLDELYLNVNKEMTSSDARHDVPIASFADRYAASSVKQSKIEQLFDINLQTGMRSK